MHRLLPLALLLVIPAATGCCRPATFGTAIVATAVILDEPYPPRPPPEDYEPEPREVLVIRTTYASRPEPGPPANLSAEAVACIGHTLGTAAAPSFDGAPVVVGTTYFLR